MVFGHEGKTCHNLPLSARIFSRGETLASSKRSNETICRDLQDGEGTPDQP